jgi:hypothetical protein
MESKKFEPWMLEEILKLGAQGMTISQIAKELGVWRQRLYEWRDENPLIADTLKQSVALAQAWYEDLGRKHLVEDGKGPTLNTKLYEMMMRNRFGYNVGHESKVNFEQKQAEKLSTEELIALYKKESK